MLFNVTFAWRKVSSGGFKNDIFKDDNGRCPQAIPTSMPSKKSNLYPQTFSQMMAAPSVAPFQLNSESLQNSLY